MPGHRDGSSAEDSRLRFNKAWVEGMKQAVDLHLTDLLFGGPRTRRVVERRGRLRCVNDHHTHHHRSSFPVRVALPAGGNQAARATPIRYDQKILFGAKARSYGPPSGSLKTLMSSSTTTITLRLSGSV